MKIARIWLLSALLASPLLSSAAEFAFVIDKLLVGIHQEENLNSAIVKVLPTGSKLEVLARKGEAAKVKDSAGVVGWVDTAYLMPDPPAAEQLAQLKQDKQALADRVKALEAAGGKGGAPGTKVDVLTNENTELKSQLSAQKLRTSELETELNTLKKAASSSVPGGGTVAAELQKANLRLTEELEASRREVDQLRSELAAHGPLGEVKATIGLASPAVLTALVLGLIAAFGGGIYVMDYLNRRRHGGFRV